MSHFHSYHVVESDEDSDRQSRKRPRVETADGEEVVELNWFLLTSANLSQAAWGVAQVIYWLAAIT